MSPCHSSFEELHINLLRVMHSGFVSVTVHRRSFKMQRLSAPPSEMSSQDTQTVAPYIQWAPSQLGKVHCTAEEGRIVFSDPTRIIFFLPGLCAIRLSRNARDLSTTSEGQDLLNVCIHICVQRRLKWNICVLRNGPKFGGEAVCLLLFQMFWEDYCLTGYLHEQ